MARIVLVRAGAGAPDLLTPEAWQALSRGPALTAPGDPLAERLREVGMATEDLPEAAADRLRAVEIAADPEPVVAEPHAHEPVAAGQRRLAGRLADLARGRGEATFVVPEPGGEAVVRAVLQRALAGDVEVEVVVGRPARGHLLLGLVAVMARLRAPGGCPWDREQSHESLVRYLLDEAHELVEAIESGGAAHIEEELGDLLLQVVFHAQIATDEGRFDIDDVADRLVRKLVTRHPHVFGDVEVSGAREVIENWEAIKEHEKGRASVIEGVPESLPALAYAQKLLHRAGAAGERAAPDPAAALEALGRAQDMDQAFGDVLLSMCSLAEGRGLDAEGALRRAARAFRDRLARVEAGARERGLALREVPAEEMERLWREAGAS